MTDEIVFDHLAVASESALEQFWRYYGELGGELAGGGLDPGFWFWQVRYASGLKIEILQDDPNQPKEDFLRRFLDRNGAGPHHLTFKVPDVEAIVARADAAGYQPVGVELEGDWQQAFLHPKQAPGVVIQMAHSNNPPQQYEEHLLPLPKCRQAADLERVTLMVTDLDREVALFTGFLAGTADGSGTDEVGDYTDVMWPNGGRLRLVVPTDAAASQWLGDRTGRIHHAAFRAPDLDTVSNLRPIGEGLYEVAPEHNFGLRLRLRR